MTHTIELFIDEDLSKLGCFCGIDYENEAITFEYEKEPTERIMADVGVGSVPIATEGGNLEFIAAYHGDKEIEFILNEAETVEKWFLENIN